MWRPGVTDDPLPTAAEIRDLKQTLELQTAYLAAVGRACLAGLASLSGEARAAICDSLLKDPAQGEAHGAIDAIMDETRLWLSAKAVRTEALRDQLECALVRKADSLPKTDQAANDGADLRVAALR
jgi:hypothetical protein